MPSWFRGFQSKHSLLFSVTFIVRPLTFSVESASYQPEYRLLGSCKPANGCDKKAAEAMAEAPAVEESGFFLAIQKGRLRGESF